MGRFGKGRGRKPKAAPRKTYDLITKDTNEGLVVLNLVKQLTAQGAPKADLHRARIGAAWLCFSSSFEGSRLARGAWRCAMRPGGVPARGDAEIDALKAKRDEALRAFGNLLAVIYRDGGHRQGELEAQDKALDMIWRDAADLVLADRQRLEEAEELLREADTLRRAENTERDRAGAGGGEASVIAFGDYQQLAARTGGSDLLPENRDKGLNCAALGLCSEARFLAGMERK